MGDPVLIKDELGPIAPVGVTQAGALYFSRFPKHDNVYVIDLDPETGSILGRPRRAIRQYEGRNATPDYSPDGKYIAYVSRRGPSAWRHPNSPGGNVLCIRSLADGEQRELYPRLDTISFPRWSPDGNRILVWSEHPRPGFYIIDIHTGNATSVVLEDEVTRDIPPPATVPHWSDDGKALVYGRRVRQDSAYVCQILERDLESETERELYREVRMLPTRTACSPDGRWLALFSDRSLKIIPMAGGKPEELHKWNRRPRPRIQTWTPDSGYLLFTTVERMAEGSETAWVLWRISVQGGEPHRLGVVERPVRHLRIHPGGRHIAFTSYDTGDGMPELWVMEKALHQLEASEQR